MTVTALEARNEYTATASQTVFNYTFLIFTATDLNVYITASGETANDATDITTAYTVDPGTIGNPAGGFITMNSGVDVDSLVTLVSDIPENRTVDYQNSGEFRPDTVNADFDKVVSLVKQAEQTASRSLQFSESQQNVSSVSLSTPEAGLYLIWNAAASGVENSGAPGVLIPNELIGTATQMVAASTHNIGDFVTTSGYSSSGDGGDNTYEIVAAATGTDDGGTFIDLSGSGFQAKGLFPGGVVNVIQYGADPTGVSDSSTNIQAAIDSGRNVYFPEGVYLSNALLTMSSTGQVIYGDKSRASDSATSGFAAIKFKGLAVGNQAITVNAASCCIRGLTIYDDDDVGMIAIKGARLTNTDDMDVEVVDNIIYNFATACDIEGRGAQVHDNIFALLDTCLVTSWPTSGTEGTGDQALPNGYRSIKFVDNLCHAVGIMVDAQGNETEDLNGMIISGNQGDVGERVFVGQCNRSTIENNVCLFSNSTPILFTGDVSAIVINGNTIGGDINSLAQTPANIIRADGIFDQCSITGNTFGRCDSHTINIGGSILGGAITGNTFTDYAADATGFMLRLAGATCNRLTYCVNSGNTGSVSTNGGLLIESGTTFSNMQVQLNTASGSPFSALLGTDDGGNNIQT